MNTTTNLSAARYVPFREEWEDQCEHPLCKRLHANQNRFNWATAHIPARLIDGVNHPAYTDRWHKVLRSEWIIIDTETGERASDSWLSETFDTRRDAVRAIAAMSRKEVTA